MEQQRNCDLCLVCSGLLRGPGGVVLHNARHGHCRPGGAGGRPGDAA